MFRPPLSLSLLLPLAAVVLLLLPGIRQSACAFSPAATTTGTGTTATTAAAAAWQHPQQLPRNVVPRYHHRGRTLLYMAGGFEWEDPTEAAFDQGVDNPFKNPELTKGMDSEGGAMKIDPARLLGPRLNGVNLYLIGMMGSGKSSVGDIVARREYSNIIMDGWTTRFLEHHAYSHSLPVSHIIYIWLWTLQYYYNYNIILGMGSYNFLDTDAIIEKATGMTIPAIFDAEGEEGFRAVESQVLDSVHSYVRCVVSTGGGLVTKLENWGKLQSGIVVWLDVEPETIMKRIEGTDRPLLQTDDPLQTLTRLLEERKSKYSQADLRIEISEDMDEESVASKIIFDLHNHIDENPPAWKTAQQKAQTEGLDWV